MAIIKKKDFVEDDILKGLQKDLDNTNKKVIKLTKANKALAESLDLIKKSSDGKEAKKLIETTNKLTTSTKKLKAALTDEERVKQQILKENVKLSNSRTKAAKDLALVKAKTQQQTKALRDQAKATIGAKKGISGMTKSILGSVGLLGGMAALVNVFKNAFKTFTEFSKSSSKLAAILNTTKTGIKTLTEQAQELGATTAFTASEVIGLQTELAKLGFSLKEIENSTPGILALAAATGTDLASAAELAGATLRIFNLDASEMSRVTDVLAKSTTISSLSMAKLAAIMPIVGKTAQIAGLSLERTAALAGTLTDRGLDASSAGTALRNIFLKLAKDGRTWNGAMEVMRGSTDKLKTSIDLFGVRSSAAGIILSETESDVNDLTMALNDADGAAQDMADTMLDNLSGDITKANSAWEGFILSLADGEGIISKVLRIATGLFTNLLTALTELNNNVTLFESKFKRSERVTNFLAKATKKYTSDLKELTTNEEKLNFIHSKSINLKHKLRANTFVLAKAEKELAEAGFLNKEALTEEVNQLKFNNLIWLEQIKILDKLTPSKKKDTKEVEKSTKAIKKNTKATKENKKEKDKIVSTGKTRETARISTADMLDFDPVKDAQSQNKAIEDNNKIHNDRLIEQDKSANATKLANSKANEQAISNARATIVDASIAAAGQILADSISFGIDARAAAAEAENDAEQERNEAKAEANKEILTQNLEEGLITEKEFKDQSAKIDENLRVKNEKLEKETKKQLAIADKKKALFDVGIATAVGIARVIPNPIAMALAATLGALQLAVVTARSIPEFEKGEIDIRGLRHSRGGINANIEDRESVINRIGTANAPMMLNDINNGLFKDSDIDMMKNNDNYSYNMLQLNGLVDELRANGNLQRETNKMLAKSVNVYDRNGLIIFEDIDGNVLKRLTKN